MRTIIFALLLFTLNAFAAPQPNVWVNPWSTNRSPMPVMATNTLSVSNVIPGGNGSNWLFYGIGPRTVATLNDITNAGNGNWVAKQNGFANQLTETNGTNIGYFYLPTTTSSGIAIGDSDAISSLVGSWPNDAGYGFIYLKNGANGHRFTSTTWGYYNADTNNFWQLQTYNNPDALSLASDFIGTASKNGVGTVYDMDLRNIGGFLSIHSMNGLQESGIGNYDWNFDTFWLYYRNNGTLVFTVTTNADVFANNQTNSGTLDVADTLTTYGGITDLAGITELGVASFGTGVKFGNMTAGKLASYVNISGATYLSNSIYSDSDIANALAGLASTNIYILTNKGTGYFTQLYSPTNTAQASNQVAQTINTPTGQTNNLTEWLTNNVRQAWISSLGQLNMPNGIGFPSETTTRFYLPSANRAGIDVAGQNALRVLLSGGARPAFTLSGGGAYLATDTRLCISNVVSAGENALTIYGLNRTIPDFQVSSNGNVGIGTTTPAAKLDVVGGINSSNLVVTNTIWLAAATTPISGPNAAGATLQTDGTNWITILQNAGGGKVTNKLSMTAWP